MLCWLSSQLLWRVKHATYTMMGSQNPLIYLRYFVVLFNQQEKPEIGNWEWMSSSVKTPHFIKLITLCVVAFVSLQLIWSPSLPTFAREHVLFNCWHSYTSAVVFVSEDEQLCKIIQTKKIKIRPWFWRHITCNKKKKYHIINAKQWNMRTSGLVSWLYE